ncbi:hypothetical protein E1293_16240 [Actinomadura darangshiensis]|uniref:Uncharacterized protein n=1 Tax=Actinomadura darangshiensis TaxID=705336 RepID=A0A4R5BAR9_9ACTN|nr:hypothetical protein [Actinomadura darangshiensis]TDD82585.1 hypothetical protein E1293_16240 [Actinomadura darangshiensis]
MTVGAGAQPGAGPTATPAGGFFAQRSPTWQRFHYAVGVFLIAYGVAGLAGAVLLWGDRLDEIERYFGSGPATGILVFVKAVEVLLVVCAAAGLALRRDVLLVPPMAGWMAGFAMFAVLDVFKGRWGGLAEHLAYLAAFVVLLFVSYGLSAKAQLAGAPKDAAPAEPGRGPGGLTRTQEFALQAINRAAALTGPRPRPEKRD